MTTSRSPFPKEFYLHHSGVARSYFYTLGWSGGNRETTGNHRIKSTNLNLTILQFQPKKFLFVDIFSYCIWYSHSYLIQSDLFDTVWVRHIWYSNSYLIQSLLFNTVRSIWYSLSQTYLIQSNLFDIVKPIWYSQTYMIQSDIFNTGKPIWYSETYLI